MAGLSRKGSTIAALLTPWLASHVTIAEWREKAKEPREHRSVIEGLQQGAKRLAARSADLEKLADAAKPLYDSLDDAQRGRFRALLHIAAGKHWHHGHEGFRHS
jgi:zinc resistance-associated protein